MFADIDVTPGNGVATDAIGEFSVNFLVPGLEVGQHTVQISVAGVTASSVYHVTVPGVTSGAPTPVAEAFESLGDRLVRVFHFNNDSETVDLLRPGTGRREHPGPHGGGRDLPGTGPRDNGTSPQRRAPKSDLPGGNCWNQIVW